MQLILVFLSHSPEADTDQRCQNIMLQWISGSQAAHEEEWFLSILNSGIKVSEDYQEQWIQGKSWQNIFFFLVNYKARGGDLTVF